MDGERWGEKRKASTSASIEEGVEEEEALDEADMKPDLPDFVCGQCGKQCSTAGKEKFT